MYLLRVEIRISEKLIRLRFLLICEYSYRNKNNQPTTDHNFYTLRVYDTESGEHYLHSPVSLPLRDIALDRTRTQVTGHRQAIYLL